jgi:hypothetical protein
MNTIVKAGVVLGVLVEVWTYIMGFTGWFKDPSRTGLFWVVVAIEIAVLMWALKRTATQGRGYGGQIGAGTLISLIGGVFVVVGSMILTTVVFPHYLQDVAAFQEHQLRAAGKSDAEIQQVMAMVGKTLTPAMQAFFGFCGTLVTGIVVSAIIGAFFRAKKTAPAAA